MLGRVVVRLRTTRNLGQRRVHTSARVIFSGIQPTGTPHLGNYLGALSNWVELQRTASENDTLIFSIVGLHAITAPQDPSQLRKDRLNAVASLLAIGIDPKRSILFHQDEVHEHAELGWILGCLAPIGRLNRMTTYKSKLASSPNEEKLGLFSYPVLQAADILLYKATHVPVGEDQRQHLELTRDLAQVFNQRCSSLVFPSPETLSTPAGKRILSLRSPTQKMSKSATNPKSRILISDSKDEIEMKIRKAVTDSERHISYDPVRRPGISNLLCILHQCRRLVARPPPPQSDIFYDPCSAGTHSPTSKSSHLGSALESGTPRPTPHFELSSSSTLAARQLNAELSELAESFQAMQTPQFKEAVVHAVEACIGPIRAEFEKIRSDESYIRHVTRDGALRAQQIAARTIGEVKGEIGLD